MMMIASGMTLIRTPENAYHPVPDKNWGHDVTSSFSCRFNLFNLFNFWPHHTFKLTAYGSSIGIERDV
jgi:hypothetical protein